MFLEHVFSNTVTLFLTIGLTCTAIYSVAGIFAGEFRASHWSSYIHLAVLGGFFLLNIWLALAVIGLGTLSLMLYWTRTKSSQEHPHEAFRYRLWAAWLALCALAVLLSVTLAYHLMGGALPLQFVTYDELPALAVALLVGLVVSVLMVQVCSVQGHSSVATLSAMPSRSLRLLLSPFGRPFMGLSQRHIPISLVVFAFIPVTVISPTRIGLWGYGVMMGVVALQMWQQFRVDSLIQMFSRQVQEAELVNNVSQAIAETLELDEVLYNIYKEVSLFVSASAFYIALYDASTDSVEFRLVMADGKRVYWDPRPAGDGVTERVIRTRAMLRLSASERKQMGLDPLTASVRYQDFLGIPLMVGTKVLGVMAILSAESEDAFTAEDIRALQGIAHQAALTMRNAVLFAQQTETVRNLSLLNESVQQVLFNPDRESALHAICSVAQSICKTEKVAIYLRDAHRTDDHFVLAYSLGMNERFRQGFATYPFELSRFSNGPHLIADASEMPLYAAFAAEGEFQSLGEIPLHSTGVVQGVLVIYYDTPHHFNKTELNLLTVLANQVSAMLDNLQVFQILEVYAVEMAQLVHLSRLLTSSLELEDVSTKVASLLLDLLQVDRVSILMINPQDQRMEVLNRALENQSVVQHLHKQDIRLIPEFYQFRDMFMITPAPQAYHLETDAISLELKHLMEASGERSLATMPIIVNDELLGLVLLGSEESGYFHHKQWQFLEMAVNQMGSQVKNAQLYRAIREDLQERLEQVSLIEDIAKQVSSSLDFRQIIDHVLEAAMRATQADSVSLGLVTDDGSFWIIEQQNINGALSKHHHAQEYDQGVFGRVVQTMQPVLLPDNRMVEYYTSNFPGIYLSALAVPLEKDGVPIGGLMVESAHTNFFNDQQASFLKNLASHAVISIDNARFLEEREYEIAMLTNLRALSLRLISAGDTRAVAEAILETAIQLLEGQDALLYLYNAETEQISLLKSHWDIEDPEDALRQNLAQSIALSVAEKGDSLMVDDVMAFVGELDNPRLRPRFSSALGVPIKRGNQVRAVLFVSFVGQRIFEDRELNTIDLLASQAAGHLENASLHEQIRAGRDQMRAILDSTRDGMILLNREVRLVETNYSARRLLGISLENHIGDYFPNVLQKYVEDRDGGYAQEELQNMARILRLEPQANTRRQFSHVVQQKTIHIEEVGSPVTDEAGKIVGRLLVLRDITEERLLEEHREDLTRMMIHDLRGPLGSIISGLEIMQYKLDKLHKPHELETVRRLMGNSLVSGNRLLRMVTGLLDISQEMVPTIAPVELSVLVNTAYMALLSIVQEANITVHCDIPENLPLVRADQDKIERVLINLIDNAIHYTPDGQEILVRARLDATGHFVEVAVADSGPGIPLEERDNIFQKFRRIKGQDPLRGAKGSGLGLTFCKMTIEAHKGKLRVANESPLSGACFVFTLPVA